MRMRQAIRDGVLVCVLLLSSLAVTNASGSDASVHDHTAHEHAVPVSDGAAPRIVIPPRIGEGFCPTAAQIASTAVQMSEVPAPLQTMEANEQFFAALTRMYAHLRASLRDDELRKDVSIAEQLMRAYRDADTEEEIQDIHQEHATTAFESIDRLDRYTHVRCGQALMPFPKATTPHSHE